MTTALVTGSASGIGLEITRQLLQRGIQTFAVCRKPSHELMNLPVRLIKDVDLTAPDAEKRLREAVGNTSLNLLFNNAGVFENETLGEMNLETIRKQFEVNTMAPLRVVMTLLPQLGQGSKIIITTSRMGSIADNTSGGYYGYRMSKAAVNMLGKDLALDLAPRGIAVGLLHPGYVKTKMTGNQGEITPEVSAQGILKVTDQLTVKNSGGFWHSNGERLPW